MPADGSSATAAVSEFVYTLASRVGGAGFGPMCHARDDINACPPALPGAIGRGTAQCNIQLQRRGKDLETGWRGLGALRDGAIRLLDVARIPTKETLLEERFIAMKGRVQGVAAQLARHVAAEALRSAPKRS
jgi:hypothetical protein